MRNAHFTSYLNLNTTLVNVKLEDKIYQKQGVNYLNTTLVNVKHTCLSKMNKYFPI